MKANGLRKIEYPKIDPVPEGKHRPFWSVMIPTYNCANYLVETLESLLAKDPGPEHMQIEVVDDCSTKDNPEQVVREIGKGRVSFYRQPQNVGLTQNFNTCIRRSIGQVVHILHGDDKVAQGFYERLKLGFHTDDTVGAAFSRHHVINDHGHWLRTSELERQTPGILKNWIEHIALMQRIQFPAIAVKRKVYEAIGGFTPNLSHAADWEMWRRIAVHFPVWFEPKVLAHYRSHSSSHTSQLAMTGDNLKDIHKSIEIAREYLPKSIADPISDKAREYCAFSGINHARYFYDNGCFEVAVAQLHAALACHFSPQVVRASLLLLIKAYLKQLKFLQGSS
ncbi:MAG: glycosyltransferase [Moorea sp. SIOASIH]|uniref:glycosyltransferase family 2 protein n=1 Tax=Moorena sp. SIOASIH TaxID=2607817 RepID=UPI0013B9F91D|nr:glycosyltransferase [Moorena sp. SIOASIH]NEO42602.1 glycosyltransferase [Moorena sp. SIOASIH]